MFYTVVMGLGGLALAYERLNLIFGISGWIFEVLRWTASLAYTVISTLYAAKLIRYPQAFTAEFFYPHGVRKLRCESSLDTRKLSQRSFLTPCG